jgi:hypothetical protein
MQRCAYLFCVAVATWLSASGADAQQLKPYFLVIFDTSGSMTWCSGGNESQYGANDCSCLNNTSGPCGGTGVPLADSAFKQNRCGFPSNRIGDAKCALQRIVDATSGDAVFGLMQFEHPCSNSCTGNALTGGGQGCTNGGTAYDDGQLVVGIQNNNTSLLREWVDGTNNCQGACSGTDYRHELYSGVWTPIGKSLQRANEYLRGTANKNTGGFLYPTDPSSSQAVASPIANDSQLRCRPVSVILLTDGKETCGGNGPAAATTLYGGGDVFGSNVGNKAFRTYVIGFGGSGDSYDPVALTSIASNGGTNTFYPASNEAQLSSVLNQIIADAQPPIEVCNGMDDDCDGNSDEGIKKFCDKPHGTNDEVLCDEPDETNCDGIDDDCDGIIDEGLTNACGTCGDLPKEICDGADNDCDQRIDEGASSLEDCGTDTGECQKGHLVCFEGTEHCEGQVGPGMEICDCKDNDCDGNTDEEGGSNPLCPDDQRCAGCKCVPFCKPAQEFGNTCEPGLAPSILEESRECICVVDNCNSTQCAGQTKQQGGEVVCGPGNNRVGTCVCQAGECVGRCTGKTCENNTVCSPRNGECVENNCRGLGCADGELCDPMSADCVKDKCKGVDCEDGELCRGGTCEKSCGAMQCKTGETCKRGECVENKCSGVKCETEQVCNPSDGECITDACSLQLCPKGQACSVESGMCGSDPCWDVKCPSGQSCTRGECLARNAGSGSAGSMSEQPSGGKPPEPPNRLFATGGGGGCSCSVPGPTGPSGADPRLSMLGVGFGVMIALRLRRRRRRARTREGLAADGGRAGPASSSSTRRRLRVLGFFALACMSLLAACKVSPLCLDAKCGTAGGASTSRDSSVPDTGIPPSPIDEAGLDAGPDGDVDAETDGGPPTNPDGSLPMCTPTGPEVCNGKDDDCDFRADEDTTAPANSCMLNGVCAGTLPICISGKFVCRYDTDWEMEETRCDGKDNDCDGKIDESFAALGMSCEVGVGACKVTGMRVCNAAGTNLVCEIAGAKDPGEEVCNGIDDDCDGSIDEPKGEPGMNASYVHDDFVQVGSSLWVYKYEASRADATDAKAGILTTRACSRSAVLPWTDLTFAQAKAACEASGLSVCSVTDWTTACKGQSTTCKWAYTSGSGCNAYETDGSDGCNGHNVNAAPGSPDTDVLKTTGSMSECYADFGAAGQVFDLSGNAKEWTSDTTAQGDHKLRGGSYNNAPMGLQCDFDFSVGGTSLHLPNVGFRCCTSDAP